MKNNLENIISENREFFNDAEPQEGHFDRFEKRLEKEFGKQKKLNIRIIWQVAAAIAFTFLAINQAIIYFTPKESLNNNLASVSPEYGEIETYYVSAINSGLTNWDALQNAGILSTEEKSMLDEELKEFDSTFKNLQEELKANPDDERVINAMIEFYQSKLNVITIIIENIKEVKRIKNEKYETKI